MERLLSPAMHRRVLLLNLLNEPTGWLTTEWLANKVDSSKKTIMQDCQYLEDRWPNYFMIETSRKYGVRLITSPQHSIHDIYIEIIKESSAFSLLEAIFFQPKQSAEYWEEKLFLSSSSLYRLSNFILSALKDRNLQLNRAPYFVFSEDERQVRYFFTAYFMEIYGVRKWPFPLDKDKIFYLANKMNRQFQLGLADSQMIHLTYSIAVSIIREQQGFLIQKRKETICSFTEKAINIKKYQSDIEEIVEPLNSKVPDNWYENFYYSIFWWEFGWDNQQEKKNLKLQAHELLNIIREALTIEISPKSTTNITLMIEHIYAKHKMFPYKKYMVYNRAFYTSKIIKQTFLIFSEVVTKALADLEKKTDFPWNSMYGDEILFEMVIHWEKLAELSDKLRSKISILVISDLGKDHSRLISSLLTSYFREKVIIHCQEKLYYETFKEQKQLPFDLYVSNYTLEGLEQDKNLVIEDIPSFKNITDIRKFVDKKRLVLPKDVPYLFS